MNETGAALQMSQLMTAPSETAAIDRQYQMSSHLDRHLDNSVSPIHIQPSGTYAEIQHSDIHAGGDDVSPYPSNVDGSLPIPDTMAHLSEVSDGVPPYDSGVSNNMGNLPRMHGLIHSDDSRVSAIGEVSQSAVDGVPHLRNDVHHDNAHQLSQQNHVPFDAHNISVNVQYAPQPISQEDHIPGS